MYTRQIDICLQFVLPFFALAAAMLMVSRVPYPHLVNQVFRGQKPLRHLVGIIFSVVAIMVFRDYAVSIVCVTFVLYGPARYAWEKVVQRQHQEESIF
jgi:phosphatidylserine synthase